MMLKLPTTFNTDTTGPASVVLRSSSVTFAFLLVLFGVSKNLTAGCLGGSAPAFVEVGLHLGGLSSAQKPVAEGCWWYSGLARVVYEEGRLKYFPVLDDTECHGPGCKKKPTGPGVEPVLPTTQRNADVGDPNRESNTWQPVGHHGYISFNAQRIPRPFLPGILRPPCAA